MTDMFHFRTLPFGSKWNKPSLIKAHLISDTYNVNGKMYVIKFTCREHTMTVFIITNIWEAAQCGFDLHFSDNEWCWASFHVFVSHLYVFFGEMSSSLAHFLIASFIFLELSCMNCLYIFEINSLSVVLFAITFSHSEGCLFTLLIRKRLAKPTFCF